MYRDLRGRNRSPCTIPGYALHISGYVDLYISSSAAYFSPLLDEGLPMFLTCMPVHRHSLPSYSDIFSYFFFPSSVRSSLWSLYVPGNPVENFLCSTLICSSRNVICSPPFQFLHSFDDICNFRLISDPVIPLSISLYNSNHRSMLL